jgi:hypothetical protein
VRKDNFQRACMNLPPDEASTQGPRYNEVAENGRSYQCGR